MTHPVSQPARDAGYETRDAEPRPIVLAVLVLALVLGLAMAASAWISQAMVEAELEAHGPPPDELAPLREDHQSPELQSQPARALRQQRAWEEEQLHGTAWVDPVNRVVRIPIERAMEKSLAEGYPVGPQDGGKR